VFAEIHGAKLYYEIAGAGRPVLTLHGGPGIGDHGDNKKMLSSLEDEFRFIYYDQRGNGQSEESEVSFYTHRQCVEDAEGLRRELGLGPVALAGGSYGGIIAMEYALAYQENLTHLILRGTAASRELQEHAFRNALEADLPGVTEEKLGNLFYGRMQDNDDLKEHFALIFPLYSKTSDPNRTRELFRRKEFNARTHNAFFQDAFPAYDIRDRLGEIEVKTLILAGRHDWITPLRFAEEIAEGIPNAELVIFEQSGHSIHTDEPEKFEAVTREFLRS
jgi:proline iminopeptidase